MGIIIELYFSGNGNSDDMKMFGLMFIYYAVVTMLLLHVILKRTHEQISMVRFISGTLLLYIMAIILLDPVLTMISGLDTVVQSPGAGLLAIFLVMLPIVAFFFYLINVFIYRTKNKRKVIYLFMAAQPLVAFLFLILLTIGSFFRLI